MVQFIVAGEVSRYNLSHTYVEHINADHLNIITRWLMETVSVAKIIIQQFRLIDGVGEWGKLTQRNWPINCLYRWLGRCLDMQALLL